MSQATGIEWTDATWNPVRGCSRVSEGCRNCYAERVAARFSGPGLPYEGLARQRSNGEPQWTGSIMLVREHLEDPLRWKRPRRVFVNSMSDLFHPGVPDSYINAVFGVMCLAHRHQFQILTKRPGRMRDFVSSQYGGKEPLPNVWLGVSVENQEAADERIPLLLDTPAAIRFLSCAPLLGPVSLQQSWRDYLEGWDTAPEHVCHGDEERCHRMCPEPIQVRTAAVDWVIVGGESGPGARSCDIHWVRDLVAQCGFAGVPCFVKQLGSNPDNSAQPDGDLIKAYIRDRKGGDMAEWPEDLRVRQFPDEVLA